MSGGIFNFFLVLYSVDSTVLTDLLVNVAISFAFMSMISNVHICISFGVRSGWNFRICS